MRHASAENDDIGVFNCFGDLGSLASPLVPVEML